MQSLDFGHGAFSYYSFAAGVRAFGLRAALNAAVTYGLPLEHALQYVRRYYGVAPSWARPSICRRPQRLSVLARLLLWLTH